MIPVFTCNPQELVEGSIVIALNDETPHDDIRAFCDYVGISSEYFFEVAERFRNHDIWSRRDGVWVIDDFLVPDFPWDRVPAGA